MHKQGNQNKLRTRIFIFHIRNTCSTDETLYDHLLFNARLRTFEILSSIYQTRSTFAQDNSERELSRGPHGQFSKDLDFINKITSFDVDLVASNRSHDILIQDKASHYGSGTEICIHCMFTKCIPINFRIRLSGVRCVWRSCISSNFNKFITSPSPRYHLSLFTILRNLFSRIHSKFVLYSSSKNVSSETLLSHNFFPSMK